MLPAFFGGVSLVSVQVEITFQLLEGLCWPVLLVFLETLLLERNGLLVLVSTGKETIH